jgi:hypothetical protein
MRWVAIDRPLSCLHCLEWRELALEGILLRDPSQSKEMKDINLQFLSDES